MKLAMTRAAATDLASIRAYIRQDSPRAADRIGARLLAACEAATHWPERGRPGGEPGTRELTTVWPYVIVYRVKRDTLQVLRIWHGSQSRS